MNSSGVPTQGIVVSEATTAKKRNDRGTLGKGTISRNMKRRHRADMKSRPYISLKEYVKKLAAEKAEPNTMRAEDVATAKKWLEHKGLA